MTVLSGFYTKHFGQGSDRFNSNNVGIGLMNPDGWLGGVYKNSLGDTSAYAGKHWEKNLAGPVNMGLTVAGVTGYPKAAVVPAVLPELSADLPDRQKLALLLIPPVPGTTPAAISLQYRKSF